MHVCVYVLRACMCVTGIVTILNGVEYLFPCLLHIAWLVQDSQVLIISPVLLEGNRRRIIVTAKYAVSLRFYVPIHLASTKYIQIQHFAMRCVGEA